MTRHRLRHLLQRGAVNLRPTTYPVLDRASWAGRYPLDCGPFTGTAATPWRPSAQGDYLHPVATCFLILHTLQSNHNRAPAINSLVSLLCEAQQSDGSWRYPVPVARYDVAPGWCSGMAQGLAISALLRAGPVLSGGERRRARHVTDLAYAHLVRSVAEDGSASYDDSGRPFYEECPALPMPYILNGAAFAMIGAFDFESLHGLSDPLGAFSRLEEMLPRWDLGYWSRYDLLSLAPASPDYHHLHVSLLRVLAELYDSERTGALADTFYQYSTHRRKAFRALGTLTVERLLMGSRKGAGE